MRVDYDPQGINNFHNQPAIRLRITGETDYQDGRKLYVISKGQNRKIEKHFCGITDCRCPQGGTIEIAPDVFAIRVDWCEHLDGWVTVASDIADVNGYR